MSFSTPLLPMPVSAVVTLIGDFLAPLPIKTTPASDQPPTDDQDPDDLPQNTPSHEHTYTYAGYQHHCLQLILYETLGGGQIPDSFKPTAATLKSIRLRTTKLEDLAILKCFLTHFQTVPLLQPTDHTDHLKDLQFQFCLRRQNASPVASISPLSARVERFLHFSSISPDFHRAICKNPHLFLPVTPKEPLDDIVCSIIDTYNTQKKVKMMTKVTKQEACPLSPSCLRTQQTACNISHFIKQASLFLLLTGFIVTYTALKIALTIVLTTIVAACVGPIIGVLLLAYACKDNPSSLPRAVEIKPFFKICVYIGAAFGLLFSLHQTCRYVKRFWQARDQLFLLHKESFSICARLIVHYTRDHFFTPLFSVAQET